MFIFDTETLFLIAVILILIDIFFLTDILIILAAAIISFAIAKDIPMSLLYQIIIGLLTFFSALIIYYVGFKKFIQTVTNRFIAPTNHKEFKSAIEGKTGVIEEIDGNTMIRFNGELWELHNESRLDISVGDEVSIICVDDESKIII